MAVFDAPEVNEKSDNCPNAELYEPVVEGAELYPKAVKKGEPPLVDCFAYTVPNAVGVAAEAPAVVHVGAAPEPPEVNT